MATEKMNYMFSSVPVGLVDPKFDHNGFVTLQDDTEHCQETISIALGLFDHSKLILNGVRVTRYVKSFLMLTFGQDGRLCPFFYPFFAQLRTKAESRFNGKKKHPLIRFCSSKLIGFFLYPLQNSQSLPRWLRCNDKSDDVKRIPAGESISGLGVLLIGYPVTCPDTPLQRLHPSDCETSAPLEDPSSMLAQAAFGYLHPFALDTSTSALPRDLKRLLHSVAESIGLLSNGLDRKVQPPGCWSILLALRGLQQSESLTRLADSPAPP